MGGLYDMKKGILIAFAVLVLAGISVLICIKVIGKKQDVALESADHTATLCFEQATKEDFVRTSTFAYRFKPVDGADIYQEYIVNNADYLYSVNANNEQCKEETGVYLLCINQRYFLISEYNDWVRYEELIQCSQTDEGDYITPVRSEFSSAYDDTMIPWEWTVGLHSFDDLVEFYSRVQDQLYEVDSENQTIYLSTWNGGSWGDKIVVMKAEEEGIRISVREVQ